MLALIALIVPITVLFGAGSFFGTGSFFGAGAFFAAGAFFVGSSFGAGAYLRRTVDALVLLESLAARPLAVIDGPDGAAIVLFPLPAPVAVEGAGTTFRVVLVDFAKSTILESRLVALVDLSGERGRLSADLAAERAGERG